MFRLIGGVMLTLLALAAIVRQVFDQNYAIALAVLLVAIVAVRAMVLAESWVVGASTASFCALVSMLAIYHDHRAFDAELQRAQNEVSMFLVDPQRVRGCRSPDSTKLQAAALQACASGLYSDLGSAVQAFGGAVHLGPISGTIAAGSDALHGAPPAPARCEQAVRTLYSHCPESMAGFDKDLLQALLNSPGK